MSKYRKKPILITLIVLLVLGILLPQIFYAATHVDENEVIAYAAAFAVFDGSETKSKKAWLKKAEHYLKWKKVCGANTPLTYGIDTIYGAKELPAVYGSIEELRNGIEESLVILGDYDQMMEGKDKPETEGYTTEDFYKLLNARISAETAVLEALNNDPAPDLYTYSKAIYKARKENPIIY